MKEEFATLLGSFSVVVPHGTSIKDVTDAVTLALGHFKKEGSRAYAIANEIIRTDGSNK